MPYHFKEITDAVFNKYEAVTGKQQQFLVKDSENVSRNTHLERIACDK
jgi:hypothetical protein